VDIVIKHVNSRRGNFGRHDLTHQSNLAARTAILCEVFLVETVNLTPRNSCNNKVRYAVYKSIFLPCWLGTELGAPLNFVLHEVRVAVTPLLLY
jgi:hypothetical protein